MKLNIREDIPSSAYSEYMPSSAHIKDMTSSAHSESMPSSAHNDQPISLNNIKYSSKKIFLKISKSYRLVSTFIRSCHRALIVRPCHLAITMINICHYIYILYRAFR